MFERLKKRVVVAATLLLTFCGLQAADVARVGSTTYTSLQAAFNAVPERGTVVLLDNVIEGVYFPSCFVSSPAREVTIDLNGFSLKGAAVSDRRGRCGDAAFLMNGGSLTVEDSDGSGSISAADGGSLFLQYNWDVAVKIDGGLIHNAEVPVVEVDPTLFLFSQPLGLSVNVTGGTFGSANLVSVQGESVDLSAFDYSVTGGVFSSDPSLFVPTGSDYRVDIQPNGSYLVQAKKYIAKNGENKYQTLEAAVEEANDGDTIKMIAHSSESLDKQNGIVVTANKFGTNGLTIDLNGFTYTCNGTPVGSTGTENQAFQLLQGNKITFKNGTLQVAESEAANFRFVIQNYSNLTLEGVKVDGTNLKKETKSHYTVSNNNGSSEFKAYKAGTDDEKKTEIIASQTGDKNFAFDVCRYSTYPSVSVTVDGAKITGDVEVTAKDNNVMQGCSLSVNNTTFENSTVTMDPALDGNAVVSQSGTTSLPMTPEWRWDSTANKFVLCNAVIVDANGQPTAGYATLAEAVTAATSGATVKLLKESAGCGIIIDKSLTIDFNNHTYTVNATPLAGSSQTQNQAFQLLANNTITFKNGTIETTTGVAAKMIIQNYSNLTLDNMVLDGSDLTHANAYTLSNNNGEVKIGNKTKIIAAEGKVAFDVYDWASAGYSGVSVEITSNDVEIDGKIEFGGDRTGGLQASLTVPTDLTSQLPAPADYKWNAQGQLIPKDYVAQIGDVKYESVKEAFDSVQNDETKTITLLKSCDDKGIFLGANGNKTITFDLAGYTYTCMGPAVGSSGTQTQAFHLEQGNTITIKNGVIKASSGSGVKMLIQNYCDLTLDHVELSDANLPDTGRYVLSNNSGNVNLVNGTKITARDGNFAFDTYKFGSYALPTVTIAGATTKIEGVVQVTGGNLKLADGDFAEMTLVGNVGDGVVQQKANGTQNPPEGFAWTTNGADSGFVKLTVAYAKISGTNYETLAAAIAAVENAQTITLLKDMTIGGISIPSGKNFTLDFDDKTVTFERPGAGSPGTKTIGFQILENSTITFKDGTICCSESNKIDTWVSTDSVKGIAMVIQNYANLTLENMTVNGSNIAHNGAATRYVMSNNSGTVALTGSTSIIAAGGDYAFDTCKYGSYTVPSVTVNTTGTIEGKVSLDGGNLTLTAGTLNGQLVVGDFGGATVTKSEGFSVEAPADYKWVDNQLVAKYYVAQIGSTKYESLAEAIAAVGNDQTITLLEDMTIGGISIPSGKNFTLDFDDNTVTFERPGAGSSGTKTIGFQILENSTITFKDGTICCSGSNKTDTWVSTDSVKGIAMVIQNYANLTLENMTVNGSNIAHNGAATRYVMSNNSGTVALTGSTSIIAAEGDYAFDTCKFGSYTVPSVTVDTTGTIKGKVSLDGGNLTLTAGTLNGQLVVGDFGGATVTKSEGFSVEAPADYKWVDNQLVAKDYVAQIGSAKYESLAEAIAAVPANGQEPTTIEMLKKVEKASGISVADGKNFIVDFNGNDYLVEKPGAGSAGTTTQAFQLNEGCTVVFKNGKIACTEANKDFNWLSGDTVKGVAMVIQNYANLTLENMIIDGSNIAHNGNNKRYVMSNNCGTVQLTGSTSITACSGDVAFDVCKYKNYDAPTVTLDTTGTITGQIELSGGTFDYKSGTIGQVVTADGYTDLNPPAAFAARIDNVLYRTLLEAFEAAPENAGSNQTTIVLLKSCSGPGIFLGANKGKNIHLKLGFSDHGDHVYTYTVTGPAVGSTGTETQGFHFEEGNKILITYGWLTSTPESGVKMLIQNYCDLTLGQYLNVDGRHLADNGGQKRYVVSNNSGTVRIQQNAKIFASAGDIAFDSCKFRNYDPPTVYCNYGTVNIYGDIELSGGSLIVGTGNESSKTWGISGYTNTIHILAGALNGATVQNKMLNGTEFAVDKDYKWVTLEGNNYKTLVAKVYVAQVGEEKYETLAEALEATATGEVKTVKLLADFADIGKIILPAGVTLDGDGKTISGDSSVYINAEGGTVQNVVFENIHNDANKLSAIYGENVTGTATVTGCKFNACDWDAIQIVPLAGATIAISNNSFVAATGQKRFVHVQSAKSVDFTATVTGNVMEGVTTEGAVNVYYPTASEKINVTHNYIDHPEDVCILMNDGTNVGEKIHPMWLDKQKTIEEGLPVAAIYSTYTVKTFATLADAVAAAQAGETVTLVANCEGAGMSINKSLTIDFNGKTYTVGPAGAGSAGTETQAFQLLEGSAANKNNYVFKNGTIQCSQVNKDYTWTAAPRGIAMIINNYGNLTLQDMVVDGTNIAHNNSTTPRYTLSNNSGAVVIENTTITSGGENDFAFDVCKSGSYALPMVTFTGTNSVVNGNIELTGGQFVYGATGTSSINGKVLTGKNYADGNAPAFEARVGATLTDAELYFTLPEAVTAAPAGSTVTLLKDVSLAAQVEIAAKALTLDLNSKTISWNGGDLASGLLLVHNGAALTINDGSESGTGKIRSGTTAYAAVALTKKGDDATNPAVLTVNAGTLEGHFYAVCGNGNRTNTLVTVNGGTLTGTNEGEGGSHAIYNPQEGNVVVTGGTLSGYWSAIEMRGGSLEVSGGTLTSGATEYACNPNGNGSTTIGAAVAIVQHTTKKPLALNVTGGTFNGVKAISESNPQENDPAPQVTMSVSGGTFNGGLAITDVTQFVTGGDFAEFVLEQYCAADYIPTDANEQGRYGVEAGKFLARNMTTGKGYKTLTDAVAAVSSGVKAQTIKLLENITGPGVVVKAGQNVVIDFDGKVYTVNENVGSAGTETSGFQLLAGSTVELKNGTLTSTTAKILIQNYSDLTLTDMNLDGTKSAACKYVVSNNNGSLDVKGATSITAKEGAKAFDVCVTGYYPNGVDVTIGTTGTITGDIEYGVWGNLPASNGTSLTITNGTFIGNWVIDSRLADDTEERINISGGTYSVAVPEIYCKDGFIPKDLGGGRYGVQEGFYVARIIDETGDAPVTRGSYTNFVDTLAALKAIPGGYEGLTIKLVHANVSEALELPNGVFFDATLYYDTFNFTKLSAEDTDYTVVEFPNNQDRKLYVTESKYVAQIGTTKYNTLTDAFKAAENGDTVKVLKNFTEAVAFPTVGSSPATQLTVDLNGFTMTGTNFIELVKVSKTVTWTNVLSSAAFFLGNNADLTITNSSERASEILAWDWPSPDGDFPYCAFQVSGYDATVTIADGTYVENSEFPMVLFDEFEDDKNVGFTLNIDGGVFAGPGYVLDIVDESVMGYDYDYEQIALNVTGGDFSIGGLVDFAQSTLPYAVELKGGIYNGTTWTQEQIEKYAAEDYIADRTTDDNWIVRAMDIAAMAVSADGSTTNKFESLKAAVDAAQSGDTVYLVKEYTGCGMSITKPVTIDFGGNTYWVDKPGAGSAGTKTQAFQVLQEAGTVVFQNGTIACTAANSAYTWDTSDSSAVKGIAMVIQNYANLTLTNMVVDGSNIAHNGDNVRYVVSVNSGNVVFDATTITACGGDFAFDTCDSSSYAGVPTVTAQNGSVFTGNVELTGGDLKLVNATLNGLLVTDGSESMGDVETPVDSAIAPPTGWTWTTTGAYEGYVKLAKAVAQIGTTTYASLIEAVAAVPVEGTNTIDVLRSSEGAGIALFAADKKNITINLGTNTYTVVKDAVGSNGTQTQGFHFEKGNTVTINATTVGTDTGTLTSNCTDVKMLIQNYCDLTLNGVKIDGTNLPGEGRYVLSNNSGSVVVGAGTTVTAKEGDIAIDAYEFGTYPIPSVTINGATVEGLIEVTGGNLDLASGDFSSIALRGDVKSGTVQKPATDETLLPPAGWAWTTTGADEGKVRLATAVAKIGTTTYASLLEAVAAVPVEGTNTIDVLRSSEGAGIALFAADKKNITINLGTNTYTVVKDAVGSNGTQTQGFHFEKGNTVTINASTVGTDTGTLTSNCTDVKMLVQNYCDLTLNGVKIDGTNLPGEGRYVLSNNSGDVTLTGGTMVKAKNGDIAIDSCKYASYDIPTLTINGATVDGPVELTGGNLELVDGDFADMFLTGTVGAGKVQQRVDGTVAAPTGWAWTTTGADEGMVCLGQIVATIGDVGYATLVDAVAAVPVEGTNTIDVLRSSEGAGIALFAADKKNITINLGTNTYTVVKDAVGSNGTQTQGFHFEKGNTVTINASTVGTDTGTLTSDCTDVKMLIQNYCDLTLNGVKIDGTNLPGEGRYVLSNNSGDVKLTGGTTVMAKGGDIAIDSCKYASYDLPTLTINGATVMGPVELTGGNLELVDGDFADMFLTGTVGAGKVQQPVDGTVAAPTGWAWTTTGADEGRVCLGQVVATIGDVGYATLVDAVAAVSVGGSATIEVLRSSEGAGIALFAADRKDITINLGTNTYSVVRDPVGSSSTPTQGFHFEAGNKVTINATTIGTDTGTLTANCAGVKMLIQNYCDLTLNGVKIDGTNLPGEGRYVLSNNSGTVNLTGTTSVTAKTGDFAIDSCKYGSYPAPKVTLNTSGTITGKVELSGGDFYYQSGNMSGAVQTASNYADGQTTGFAARVGDVATASTLYFTLADAVAAAQNAETVTLLTTANPEATIVMTKDLNLDLNEFGITSTNRAIQVKSGTVNITGSGTISSNGGTLNPDSSVIRVGDPTVGGASAALTLGTNVVVSTETCYGVTVFGRNDGLALTVYGAVSSKVRSAVSGTGNSYDGPTTITIAEGATITTTDDYAIYNPQSGTLTIAGTVTGGIEAKAGTVTINEPAVVTAGSAELGHATNNNGPSTQGYALAVVNNSGYQVPARITVNGGCIDGAVTNITDNTVLEPGRVVLKGGVYSDEGVAVYCDKDLSLVTNPDPETKQAYPFAVLCDMYVYNDVETGLSVNFPRAWITSTNGLGLAAADATDEAIDAALATKTAEVMKWQYVLLGISDTNTGLLANFGKDANSTASNPKIFVTFKGLDATKQPTWETGITITYTLYTSEDASSWTAVTEGVTNTGAGISYKMPTSNAEVKTWLYQLRVNMEQKQTSDL